MLPGAGLWLSIMQHLLFVPKRAAALCRASTTWVEQAAHEDEGWERHHYARHETDEQTLHTDGDAGQRQHRHGHKHGQRNRSFSPHG